MKEIKSREEVSLLVNSFYAKIRNHEVLGPIFNEIIDDWPKHLEKLTDFWESVLFKLTKFRGNVPAAHQRVDAIRGYSLTESHFEQWLELWFETLDELFVGEKVNMAKDRANRMANGIFFAIWKARSMAEIKN